MELLLNRTQHIVCVLFSQVTFGPFFFKKAYPRHNLPIQMFFDAILAYFE
jgi:hypothetical protein